MAQITEKNALLNLSTIRQVQRFSSDQKVTMQKPKKAARGKHFLPLTETEKQFIDDHCGTMSLREMAKRLQRGAKTINDYRKENGLSDGTGKKDTRHHPWRKANHQIGLYILTSEPKTYKSSGRDKK